MSTKPIELSADEERKYQRLSLRSLFSSLFWGVIMARKKREGFMLQSLADATGRNKSQVSRWFSSNPNWTLDTIADVAQALDLELLIEARERSTGMIYTPSGLAQKPNNFKSVTDVSSSVLPQHMIYSENYAWQTSTKKKAC